MEFDHALAEEEVLDPPLKRAQKYMAYLLNDSEVGFYFDTLQSFLSLAACAVYIITTYAEKATQHDDEDDIAITDGMIDVDEEEVA